MKFKRIIGKLLYRCLYSFTAPVPPGLAIINFVCQRLLGLNNESDWPVHYTSRVVGDVEIGEGVWLSFAVSGGCYIQGNNGVKIEGGTIFAPGVKIISADHDMTSGGWIKSSPIRIGRNCWIAANAVILPGVELGDNCIVGAGAVVTKSFPRNSRVAGVPAVIIGSND